MNMISMDGEQEVRSIIINKFNPITNNWFKTVGNRHQIRLCQSLFEVGDCMSNKDEKEEQDHILVKSGSHTIAIPNYKRIQRVAKQKTRQTRESLGSNFKKDEKLEKDVTQAMGGPEMAMSEKEPETGIHPKFKEHMGKIQEIMARKRGSQS